MRFWFGSGGPKAQRIPNRLHLGAMDTPPGLQPPRDAGCLPSAPLLGEDAQNLECTRQLTVPDPLSQLQSREGRTVNELVLRTDLIPPGSLAEPSGSLNGSANRL